MRVGGGRKVRGPKNGSEKKSLDRGSTIWRANQKKKKKKKGVDRQRQMVGRLKDGCGRPTIGEWTPGRDVGSQLGGRYTAIKQ